jgi:hypothetical protein
MRMRAHPSTVLERMKAVMPQRTACVVGRTMSRRRRESLGPGVQGGVHVQQGAAQLIVAAGAVELHDQD